MAKIYGPWTGSIENAWQQGKSVFWFFHTSYEGEGLDQEALDDFMQLWDSTLKVYESAFKNSEGVVSVATGENVEAILFRTMAKFDRCYRAMHEALAQGRFDRFCTLAAAWTRYLYVRQPEHGVFLTSKGSFVGAKDTKVPLEWQMAF